MGWVAVGLFGFRPEAVIDFLYPKPSLTDVKSIMRYGLFLFKNDALPISARLFDCSIICRLDEHFLLNVIFMGMLYEASSAVEAHMMVDLLKREGLVSLNTPYFNIHTVYIK
jgi:hypothetical protein